MQLILQIIGAVTLVGIGLAVVCGVFIWYVCRNYSRDKLKETK